MIRRRLITAALCALIAGCGRGNNADSDIATIHVIGSAATSNTYQALEEPFWHDTVPKAANGRIAVSLRAIDESGLKTPQIARLLSAGALDVAYGDFASIAGDVREFEALDLAGLITDIDTMRQATHVYRPVLERIFTQHGIKLLALLSYPKFAFYCAGEVRSLEDLRGKKVRVTTQSMSDFAQRIGAVPVIIPFPDVVPALQTRVADCAVSNTYSGNKAGWYEATDSLFTLPIGNGLSFYGYSARGWNELDPALRDILQVEFEKFENAAWDLIKLQTQYGINCNTGQGECIGGKPSDMVLYEPSAADIERAHEIARSIVVPNWARRCGQKCVDEWNATVGKVVGVQAGQ